MSNKLTKENYFLDTNIFIYSFDDRSPQKKEISQNLIEGALSSGKGSISFQVIQEFLNVALRKFEVPLSEKDAQVFLGIVLRPLCKAHSSVSLYSKAVEITERYKYSFYDSLIISAALETKSKYLFSEDLQHGQKIEDLEIVCPYKK